jgi:predicted XRE-type DNA-binding protein
MSNDLGPCREWPGSRNSKGYGRVYHGEGGYITVHRLVWIAANGDIPEFDENGDRLMVLHSCDNPPCFRLDHLYLGTHADNMNDRWLAGHYGQQKGELNSQSKLTDAAVREIRRLYLEEGWKQVRIADEFAIGQPVVSDIIRRKLWAHVE